LREIRTEIQINGSPEKVWQTLTDFTNYTKWNPFIQRIEGNAKVGSKLRVYLHTAGGKNRTYNPTITKIEPNRELRWYGKAFVPGIFNGERIFTIEPLGRDRIRFIHTEIFTGLGVALAGNSMEKDIHKSLEEMNSALKAKVERSSD
jgi:hypothetical protein